MFKLGVHLIGAHGNVQFKDVSNHMEEAKKNFKKSLLHKEQKLLKYLNPHFLTK